MSDWKANTRLKHCTAESDVVKWFWKVWGLVTCGELPWFMHTCLTTFCRLWRLMTMRRGRDCFSLLLGPHVCPWRDSKPYKVCLLFLKSPIDAPSSPGSTGAAGPRLFTIHVLDVSTDNLPKAHTWLAGWSLLCVCVCALCSLLPTSDSFNRLDLPVYESYEKLYEKLTCAIEQTVGFHVE